MVPILETRFVAPLVLLLALACGRSPLHAGDGQTGGVLPGFARSSTGSSSVGGGYAVSNSAVSNGAVSNSAGGTSGGGLPVEPTASTGGTGGGVAIASSGAATGGSVTSAEATTATTGQVLDSPNAAYAPVAVWADTRWAILYAAAQAAPTRLWLRYLSDSGIWLNEAQRFADELATPSEPPSDLVFEPRHELLGFVAGSTFGSWRSEAAGGFVSWATGTEGSCFTPRLSTSDERFVFFSLQPEAGIAVWEMPGPRGPEDIGSFYQYGVPALGGANCRDLAFAPLASDQGGLARLALILRRVSDGYEELRFGLLQEPTEFGDIDSTTTTLHGPEPLYFKARFALPELTRVGERLVLSYWDGFARELVFEVLDDQGAPIARFSTPVSSERRGHLRTNGTRAVMLLLAANGQSYDLVTVDPALDALSRSPLFSVEGQLEDFDCALNPYGQLLVVSSHREGTSSLPGLRVDLFDAW